ncbi:MAG: hypothetical protein JNJ83_14205 [Verrucomicrobiaceae bacterium]|nr:hypothetical protein [Verrucomicrobiaceae bacterium]
MKTPLSSLPTSVKVLALVSLSPLVMAGDPAPKAPVVTTPPPTPSSSEWKVTSWAYGWLAGVKGTTGVHGFTTEVDVPFSGILDHLDMTASLNLEAQKGRWGGWIDAMYLKVSTGGSTPDPLLDTVSVSMEQLVAEAALFYRVWESPRGALDLYAGARYMSVTGDLSLSLSNSGVEQVSEDVSARVIDEVIDRVKSGVRGKAVPVIEQKKTQLSNQVAAKASSILNDLRAIGQSHPGLINAIQKSDRLQQAIRDAASARIDEQIALAQSKVAVVQSKVAAAKARARRAVAKAEKALAKEIERALRESIPTELSGTKDWVDPFIGVRGYYHFTDRLYATAKADIGGFGISSDLAWQVYGALGYNLTKRTTLEIGYKHMAVDYTSGGFVNDVATSGVFLNMGIRL